MEHVKNILQYYNHSDKVVNTNKATWLVCYSEDTIETTENAALTKRFHKWLIVSIYNLTIKIQNSLEENEEKYFGDKTLTWNSKLNLDLKTKAF